MGLCDGDSCQFRRAVNELIDKHYGDVYKYLSRKTGDSVLAEDLSQEVFIKFFTNIDKYTDRGRLKQYLIKIAVNVSNDYFRRRKITHSIDETTYEADCDFDNIDGIIIKHEMSLKIKAAVNQLPQYQRDVIILRYFHDMDLKTIASVTDTNISSVKSRLRQGQLKLYKLLKEDYV